MSEGGPNAKAPVLFVALFVLGMIIVSILPEHMRSVVFSGWYLCWALVSAFAGVLVFCMGVVPQACESFRERLLALSTGAACLILAACFFVKAIGAHWKMP